MESKKLVEASSGDIELLDTIPHQNPKDSPLRVPTKHGHEEVHILEIDRRLRRLESKEQRKDLHHAVSNGNIEVIKELLTACPESINDVSAGNTLLHVAVKNNQVAAFRELIKWIEMHDRWDIVNLKDDNGNTVLHIATSNKQLEIISGLLQNKSGNGVGKILEVNAKNSKGNSAMDMLDTLDTMIEDPKTFEIRQILERAGAKRESPRGWFKYFKFQQRKYLSNDTRNALLVVAALIATVTFQAGVNLPTGILKLTEQTKNSSVPNTSTPIVNISMPIVNIMIPNTSTPIVNISMPIVNIMIPNTSTSTPIVDNDDTSISKYNSKFRVEAKTYLFLLFDSAGLTSSLSIIIYLTYGYPFQRELLVAMLCMWLSFVFSITSITDTKWPIYLFSILTFLLPVILRLHIFLEMAWKQWKKICRAK